MSAPVCDVCGAPRTRAERRRLVWASGLEGDLVLADMCARCAGDSDHFLEIYGGRGRETVRLTQESVGRAAAAAPARRVGGMIVRSLVYLLLAVAGFVLVTLVTARS